MPRRSDAFPLCGFSILLKASGEQWPALWRALAAILLGFGQEQIRSCVCAGVPLWMGLAVVPGFRGAEAPVHIGVAGRREK